MPGNSMILFIICRRSRSPESLPIWRARSTIQSAASAAATSIRAAASARSAAIRITADSVMGQGGFRYT